MSGARNKIARELRRVGHQLINPIVSLREDAAQRRHDRDFNTLTSVVEGRVSLQSKTCIFLLFQPSGVSESSFETAQFLNASGYAVLAVSNAHLHGADRERLRDTCHLVMERPNYGYDFGGYRDAIMLLKKRDALGQLLLILNDSIWYPLWDADTLLPTLESHTEGLTGPVYEQKQGRRHAGHFESYFLLLGPEALTSQSFDDFWSTYRVSSRRRNVLRRGEKALSRHLIDRGVPYYTHASRADFLDLLREKDDDFLAKTLTYAAYDARQMAEEGRDILSAPSGNFRGLALDHIANHCATASLQETFVFAAMSLFDLPLMKKRQKPLTRAMRQAYLRAVEEGDLPAASDGVMAEIRATTHVSAE